MTQSASVLLHSCLFFHTIELEKKNIQGIQGLLSTPQVKSHHSLFLALFS